MIDVTLLTPELEPAWDEWVARRTDLPIYYTLPFRNVLRRIMGGGDEYRAAVTERGEIAGILPLFAAAGPLGTLVNSLPFYGSHGGIVSESDQARDALLAAYHDRIGEPDVIASTVIGNPFADGDPLAGVRADVYDARVAQFTPLETAVASPDPEDVLLQSFHQKTRNLVRKGARQGFSLAEENDAWPLLQAMHEEAMQAVGRTPKPASFYSAIASVLGAGTDYRIYVARDGGRPVAALLNLYYGAFVEYTMPVIVPSDRERQPLSFMILHAMAEAARAGYRTWNWGGTWLTQDGLYQFKRRWNTFEREYRYAIAVNDDRILTTPPSELAQAYPYSFVYPYHLLPQS